MKPKVTNVRTRVGPGSPAMSMVEVESTCSPCRSELATHEPGTLSLRLWGLRLNMDPFERPVCDGIIRSLRLAQVGSDCVECRLQVEFRPDALLPRVEELPGTPAVTRLLLSREPLRKALGGRPILIDPAHGGRDVGARGPINLEERHVVLKVAARLSHHLREAGCRVCLTRQDDRTVEAAQRVLTALACRAQLFVSIHTGHDPDPECRGVRTLFAGSDRRSAALAQELAGDVHRALLEWPGLGDRGIGAASACEVPADLLAVRFPLAYLAVEVVCLANPLEEALMRSSVFRDRLAQAIRNGISRHYARSALRGDVALAV